MLISRKLKSFSPGANNELRSILPPANSDPAQILYISVIPQIVGDYLSPDYQYGDESGTYSIPEGGLDGFLDDIRNDEVAANNSRTAPIPQDTVAILEYPAYVIFSVDLNGDVSFNYGDKIKTDDSYTSDYFNLILAPDDSENSSAPYHIAYFRAKSASDSWLHRTSDAQKDGFNLYLDFRTSNGGTGTGFIDPDVRNTGHTIVPVS